MRIQNTCLILYYRAATVLHKKDASTGQRMLIAK